MYSFSTNVVYKDSYLMAGAQRRRKTSSMSDDVPNSQPAKWPGNIQYFSSKFSEEHETIEVIKCDLLAHPSNFCF